MVSPYHTDLRVREQVAEALARLLADSFFLYLKTQAFHWNVAGPRFEPLHTLFREQYSELIAAMDEIAERIRALGIVAPGSISEFKSLSAVTDMPGVPAATTMVRQLMSDHGIAARTAHGAMAAAQACGDVASADLVTRRIARHEKTIWMLGSLVHAQARMSHGAPSAPARPREETRMPTGLSQKRRLSTAGNGKG